MEERQPHMSAVNRAHVTGHRLSDNNLLVLQPARLSYLLAVTFSFSEVLSRELFWGIEHRTIVQYYYSLSIITSNMMTLFS